MNDLIREIYQTGLVRDREGTTYPATGSVTFETGTLLYELIRAFGPERTLEIGLANGVSTLFMCQAHLDNGAGPGAHTAIDPGQEEWWHNIGLLNIQRAGLEDLFCFHHASSDVVLPQLCAQNRTFDFVFVDGSHLFDCVIVDFFYIDKLLPVGSHIAFDDLHMPGVRKAVSFVLTNRRYKPIRMPSPGPVSLQERLAMSRQRIRQEPLGRDWRLKFWPYNSIFLEKTADEDRRWDFHRKF